MKTLSTLVLLSLAFNSHAQQNRDDIEIEATKLRNGLYMFKGAGGNIAVSTGSDGVLIVDDQYADMTAKIDAAIAKLSDQPVRYVLNTHWHFDHTGGNEHYGKQGKTIIAHDNTRTRMSTDQLIEAFNIRVPASPKPALPVITFNGSATVHFNNLSIELSHVPNAHTDTDAFVIFKEANVIHSGDVYISNSYLFIDTSSGGSIQGVVSAIEKLVAISDEETIIIPGHGLISNQAEAIKTLAMLKSLKTKTEKAIVAEQTLKEFLATKPTKEFEKDFGNRGASFAEALYIQLSSQN